jgi:adenylate cyclase
VTPTKLSIAVLPFENMSGDPEQEFFADGICEDLITALSKIRWFFVIARNSTFTYKGQAVEVTQVAKDLGVRYVIEGSVRKAGKRVRITAQLIDATTGHHVWAERYDRELADIFELQDEMTRTIVGAVEPELSAAERDRALSKPPESLDAWESYQRGLWHLWSYERDHNLQAQNLLERATDLDPGFAPAYAYGSYVRYASVIMGWSEDPEQSLEAGMTLAKQALAHDDKDPTAYFAAGRIHMMQGRHDDSIAALETAIELNPSFAQAYHGLGMVLMLAGRLDESKAASIQSERLSPRDPILWASTAAYSLACILSRDDEEALQWARKTVQNPRATGFWPHAVLAGALAHLDRVDEARAEVAAALEALPDLSLAYLAKTLPTKEPNGLDPWLEGLRKAGLPE